MIIIINYRKKTKLGLGFLYHNSKFTQKIIVEFLLLQSNHPTPVIFWQASPAPGQASFFISYF